MAFIGLLLLLAVTHCRGLEATRACPPAECTKPVEITTTTYKTEDPANCHKFFYCADDRSGGAPIISDTSFWCNDEHTEVFLQDDRKCHANIHCTQDCIVNGNCEGYACTVGQVLRPHPTDCTIYYNCGDNQKTYCPAMAPFFDGKQCQGDETKCCHCKPYCYADDELFGRVVDPTDCEHYYICLEMDAFPSERHKCERGNFNYITGECDEAFKCQPLCTNVMGCDGCIEVFTCEEVGYFEKCPARCGPEFYHCSKDDLHNIVTASQCPTGRVFDPSSKNCEDPSQCNYDKPLEC